MSRVTEIRYVGYGVTDLDAERTFYRDVWGLKEVGEQDGMWHFAAEGNDELYVVRLRAAEEKRIDVIALAADSDADVDALHDKVAAAGCKVIFAPRALTTLGGGYGFRFFSPDGLPFEVSAGVERGTAREMQRWDGVPQKISHIVLHSPDHKAAVQFFEDVLGFRLSDWLGDFMAFLRCNSAHHRFAFLPGPPCLNHVAYDMLTVDDMMRGINRLKKKGTDLRWGPGRHTAGNNTFSYFTTPNGFAVEYTSELEDVDFETHEHKVHVPGPQVMDQWGIGVGGPQTMPHPEADKGLFVAAEA
ncbi:VOC family protein [Sphingomonas yantingensis]|uniref:Catechol 2,3-dioxygenase-like lactoylglutathione lyase family enzyme n=1 Tax=Sphingomonas yantingensis TaxID=1241761 RepID=A0A7W9APH8_9SPHN|nr:VOC family protein [Sphingomonas yantingensis]MBB5698077.1 catechol 2,3-dioxygenase-like lactoylglutathione lyase family enzyme [Sphingomonas yantingensis]